MSGVSVLGDARLQALIDALQAQSAAQEAETREFFVERAKKREVSGDGLDADANRFLADKMVALEPAKAEFCYLMCRALRARRVVEVGTSFGVSTLYLAAAVRDNGGGVVIGTEYEPAKAATARANFAPAARQRPSPVEGSAAVEGSCGRGAAALWLVRRPCRLS